MDNLSGFLRKAVYLGVGLASYAGEKAGDRLAELAQEAQQKADELVRRGEMTTEEAKRFVDSLLENAQFPTPTRPNTLPCGENHSDYPLKIALE